MIMSGKYVFSKGEIPPITLANEVASIRVTQDLRLFLDCIKEKFPAGCYTEYLEDSSQKDNRVRLGYGGKLVYWVYADGREGQGNWFLGYAKRNGESPEEMKAEAVEMRNFLEITGYDIENFAWGGYFSKAK